MLRTGILSILLSVFLAVPAHSASPPDWVKTFSKGPRPNGDYIAPDDQWLVLHSEVIVSPAPSGGLRREHRQVIEAIGAKPAPLVIAVAYDDVAETLDGPTVWIGGRAGHSTLNPARSSIDVPDLAQDLITANRRRFVSTKPIKPGRRVALTWTVTDREAFPGETVIVPVDVHPVARFLVRTEATDEVHLIGVEPRGAARPIEATGYSAIDIPAAREVYPTGDAWRAAPVAALPFVLASRAQYEHISWQRVARRAGALFGRVLEVDDALTYQAKATELVAGIDDPYRKAARLAEFAQSLVYRNVQWGIGAYQPTSPSEVLRSMSADCKGKVLLLQALLSAIGVRSVPVLVWRSEQYIDDRTVPLAHAFDHVVIAIDVRSHDTATGVLVGGPGDGWLLFDPTDELASFGRAPTGLEGKPGLWLGPDGDLFNIATNGAGAVEAKLDFEVLPDDSAEFVLTVTGESAYAWAARNSSIGSTLRENIQSPAQTALRGLVPGLEVAAVSYDPPDHVRATPPVLVVRGTIAKPLQQISADLYSLGAPLEILAHSLGFPRGGFVRHDPPASTPAGQRWRAPACCAATSLRRTGTVDLATPSHWQLASRPGMPKIDTPWLSAGLSGSATTWRIDIAERRGDFGANTAAQRLEDLNTVAKTLRSLFVLRHVAE